MRFIPEVPGPIRRLKDWLELLLIAGGAIVGAVLGVIHLVDGEPVWLQTVFGFGWASIWAVLVWVIFWPLFQRLQRAITGPPSESLPGTSSVVAVVPESVQGEPTGRSVPTQEQIIEHQSFVENLRAAVEQLQSNTHHNMSGSLSFYFNRFDVRQLTDENWTEKLAFRLLNERFMALSLEVADFQEMAQKLRSSTITEEEIASICSRIAQDVAEYLHLTVYFQDVLDRLPEGESPPQWEDEVKALYDISSGYNELWGYMKALRNAAPRSQRGVFPREFPKFPR